ncbi:MAG: acyl-CoA thioesterase [Thermoanaerobaculum sp.]|nr:acyl-CoA thioesterase [Thermoanaerobaculum sp.]
MEPVCRVPVEVRFRDLDAMGHVNNAVVVTYLEVARTRFWLAHFNPAALAVDFPFVVARVVVDYRQPIHLQDPVEVEVRVSHVGRSSFTLAYRVWAGGAVAAEAETVQVHYDYAQRQSKPLGITLRQQLERLLSREDQQSQG